MAISLTGRALSTIPWIRLVRPGTRRTVLHADPSELALLCTEQPVRRHCVAGGASNLTGHPAFMSGCTVMPLVRPLDRSLRRSIWR